MSNKCYGCIFYQPPYDGDNSLEGYTPYEPAACLSPEIQEMTDFNEGLAILLEKILFKMSDINNCPQRQEK